MKLLFDQNLSFKLCRRLADLFPGSTQTSLCHMAQAGDAAVWEHAKANGFVLVSLDSDFAEMCALRGPPPKVIWLRCGNQRTLEIERILRREAETVAAFGQDGEAGCLEIY